MDPTPSIGAPAPRQAASDYAVLMQRVREAGLLDKQPQFYLRSILVKMSLLAASLAALCSSASSP
jgi:hypothetical protein